MPPRIDLTATPEPGDLEFLGAQLAGYNAGDVGPSERLALAIFLRDDQNAIVGGLSGYTAWGWLYVQWLWIGEDLRGQGQAGQILEAAEVEARRRGCHGAYIDSFNPVAIRAYKRAGFEEFGRMDDFPKGRSRVFLQKRL